MKKIDILKGKFNEESVNSLSVKEKSDLIFSLHDRKKIIDEDYEGGIHYTRPKEVLRNINDIQIKNIINFLKLCLSTNKDNVEWFLLYIVDCSLRIRKEDDLKKADKKLSYFKEFLDFNFNIFNSEKLKEINRNIQCDNYKKDFYNVWVKGNTCFPFESQIKSNKDTAIYLTLEEIQKLK